MKYLQNNRCLVLVLGLFLGFAIIFRTFLIANIFEPITVLVWAAWRSVSSVHQNIYWIILVLICSIPVIRLIPFRRNTSVSAYRDGYSPINRVEDWLTLMKNASLGMAETEYLRDNLKRLLISVQQLERFPAMKLDQIAVQEAASLSLAVHRFLFPTKEKDKMPSNDFRLQLLFLTPKWFRRWAGKVFQIDNSAIEETLIWMESRMEINNDQ